MPLLTKDIAKLIIGNASSSAPSETMQGEQARLTAKNQAELKQQEEEAAQIRQLKSLLDLRKKVPGQEKYDVGNFSVTAPGASALKLQLTPAQQAAETSAGKKISDYEAGGGKATFDENVKSLEGTMKGMKDRDAWDRIVGGITSSSPAMMGLLASKEKARRDSVRNTFIGLAKQVDSNMSREQMESVFGQIYDPASTDEDNIARMTKHLGDLKAKQGDIEKASAAYKATGYATMQAPSGRRSQTKTPNKTIPPTGPHGDAVEQEGVIYRWNPQTSQYE